MTEQLDTRRQIVAAAERIIRERGLAGATTRAIALEARCAEGSIYRYFPDKQALFHEVVLESFPEFLELMRSLPDRAGSGSVRKQLEQAAVSALTFYRLVLPMMVAALADRDLLEAQRRHFEEQEGGPMRFVRALSDYLRREQRLDRIAERASVEHASRLLLGACFSQAALEALLGPEACRVDERYVKELVGSLMEGLNPRQSPPS